MCLLSRCIKHPRQKAQRLIKGEQGAMVFFLFYLLFPMVRGSSVVFVSQNRVRSESARQDSDGAAD